MNDANALVKSFESKSVVFTSLDEPSATLHVALIQEKRYGYAHSFDFTVTFENPPDVINISIDNAEDSAYRLGWLGYLPFAKRAGGWERVSEPSAYEGGRFQFQVLEPEREMQVAWYEPYDVDRMHEFVRSCTLAESSVDDSGFTVVTLGDRRKATIFVTARQHPGETIGSFFLDGLLRSIADKDNPANELLDNFCFVIIPIVNVDGAREHLHRCDERGIDYNRQWATASPPVGVTKTKEILSKVDNLFLFADIHGDEVSKTSYVAYRINPKVSKRNRALYHQLLQRIRKNPKSTFVWKNAPFVKRFVKTLVRQRRLLLREGSTANQYVAATRPCLAFTYELSVFALTPQEAVFQGKAFATSLRDVVLSTQAGVK